MKFFKSDLGDEDMIIINTLSELLNGKGIKVSIAISTYFTVWLLSLSLIHWRQGYKKNLSSRLQNLKHDTSEDGMTKKNKGEFRWSKRPMAKVKKMFINLKFEKNWAILIEKQLLQANIHLRVEEMIMGEILINIMSTGLVYFLIHDWIVSLMVFMVILIIPVIWIKMAKQKRLKIFNSQIGDSLDIISNSLKAGYGFLYAMEMVSKEMPEPISNEFSRVIQEINLGMATEQALKNMTVRVGSEDLDLVVTALLIQRQVGGNLAEILDNISKTIRERVRICGEIKTLTAQGRISGIIVGLMPIGLGIILYLVNPQYICVLFSHPIGLAMIGGGVINMVLGTLLIKRIITIEV